MDCVTTWLNGWDIEAVLISGGVGLVIALSLKLSVLALDEGPKREVGWNYA